LGLYGTHRHHYHQQQLSTLSPHQLGETLCDVKILVFTIMIISIIISIMIVIIVIIGIVVDDDDDDDVVVVLVVVVLIGMKVSPCHTWDGICALRRYS